MHLPLRGRRGLHICNLEEVGSRDEARTAKLEEKTDLESLILSWNLGRSNEMDDVTVAAADGVLEGLRPPPQLLELAIWYYPGQPFPSWMGDGGAFRRLRQVRLQYCKNCTQLPPLGQLPSLEGLTITGLQGVERVGSEFFGGPSPAFPCLKYLCFLDMRNWSEWVALPSTMPKLETLQLTDCPKLEAMPPIFTTSLRGLRIDDRSLQFLPLYKTIIMSSERDYRSMVDAHDPSINVIISKKVTELPAGLLNQTALRILKLVNLSCLRSLPEELAQLTDLHQLLITNCPELSGRCRVGGELWPKIAHIPHIQIDGQDIQCLT